MHSRKLIRNVFSLFAAISVVGLTACTQSNTESADLTSSEPTGDGRVRSVNQVLHVDTSGVADMAINSVNDPNLVHSSNLGCTLLCFTPGVTLKGTIAPPIVNSVSLQASDITVNGSDVYIGYNTAGTVEAGGVDVIGIGSGGAPTLKASTTFADTDINKLFVDSANSKLYAVGNTSSGETGAILYRFGLDVTGGLDASPESKVLRSAADADVPAHTGTGVIKAGGYVYAVTGMNGGLSVLNAADLSSAAFTAVENARDITLGIANDVLVVSGQTSLASAKVGSYSVATGAAVNDTMSTFSGSTIDSGKSTIFAGTNGYVATGGEGGTKFVCYNGTSIGSMPIPTGLGLASSEVAANAVTFGNGIIYVAQGGAGVYMYAIGQPLLNLAGCNGFQVNYVGRFALTGRQSANNVYYSNGYLVVATGNGGFQIIEVTQGVVAGLLSIL